MTMQRGKTKKKAKPKVRRIKDAKRRDKKIEGVLDEIHSRFGEGAIMRFGEIKNEDILSYPTGSISLDIALGVGGIPQGRIIEIYGPESSGKTTLTQHIISNVQKQGGECAFVDAEHAWDPEYAKKIGVKTGDLLLSQPDTGEQALDIVEALVRSGAVDLVVIDSVAALTPRAEIEGDMGDSHMGLQARLMSQALRKLAGVVHKSKSTVIFINQTRMKIGVMFGNPETTTGGNALKFYSSLRIEVRRSAKIKKGDNVVGNRVIAKVVKNKVAPPFQNTTFDLLYNQGIYLEGDIIDTGVKYGVLNKKGSWVEYEGKKLGQGRENAANALREDKKKAADIEKKIWDKVKEERAAK